MNIFESIITWSKSLKPWEQEAVRRLVVKGELTEADEDDIIKLLKEPPAKGEFKEPTIPDPQPTGAKPISLVSLEHKAGVNALAPDQTLTFGGPQGLTVIYGDNGSGKSGYSKVLKSACRSRHAQPRILPDVFSGSTPPSAATAKFVYTDGSGDITEPWTDGVDSSESLASVAVFDSKCARLYVEKEGELAYRPYGLEVFDELGASYKRIKARLAEEAAVIQVPRCITEFDHPTVKTAVDAVALDNSGQKLSALNMLGKVSDEEKKEAARLQTQITQLENDDPKKLAVSRRTLATRLASTAQKITAAQIKIQDSVKLLGDAMKKASDEDEAAKLASKAAFEGELVSGVGTEQWKAMFLDAKAFSNEVAFPGEEFPVVGDGSRCVLCHQTLDETAKDRLTRFADFIGNQAEKRARDAAKVYGDLRTGAIEAAKGIGGIDDAFVEQVLERADATATALKTMRTDFTKWQTSAEAVSSHDQWSKLIGPAAGISTVTALATKLTKEADELDKNSNADALVKLKGNLSLLNNRIALAKVLPTIIESAGAAATKRRLQVLSNTIDTAHVSRQATKTTQAVLTDALCLALNTELDALDAESLKVEFVKKGDGGGVLHYLRLKNAPRNTKIEEILSEGEHRCLAMAAFLAELGQQGHSSAIVLDDPVSSLDHKHRDKLATRLVEEAKHRQVIILSHDLAFLYAIDQAAALAQVPVRQHAVARTSDGTGVPVDGLYPEAMKLNDLIKHIKKLADEVAAMDPNDIARRGKVVDCYDLIRAAWERVVEESLLRSVVGPFDKAVHAQMLKGVFVEDEDHSTVFWAMTKASNIVDAHRTPAGGGTTVIPKDTEIAADIEQLRAFKKAADARAQEVIARRKKLESPPTH